MRNKKKVEDLSLLASVIKSGKTWKEHEEAMAQVYFDLVNEEK